MSNDRFKFRIAVKCRKCGKISFRYGQLQSSFRIVEEGDESCLHCRSYCIDIIKKDRFEQCTGLKDKNKKLCYSQDFIKHPLYGGGVIYWGDCSGAWFVDWFEIDGCERLCETIKESEIIGNIHEVSDET